METNERIDIMDKAMETIDDAVDVVAEGTKDVCKMYALGMFACGMVVTIAAREAWKRGIKPCISKLKDTKKKHDDKKLERYIQVEENDKSKKEDNDEK